MELEYKEINLEERTPDNVIQMDISAVKTLQIGYHAETIFLHITEEESFTLKEYIGYTAYEYLAKVNANRFKTTIRYGRRENVNTDTYVDIYLPASWKGELLVYTQYGSIRCQDSICLERLASESSEGSIDFHELKVPRIRLASSNNSVHVDKVVGFADIHTTSGSIRVDSIDGGAKFETSTGEMTATFHSLNNVVQCDSLSGKMNLTFTEGCNINVDGITKRGEITSHIEGIEVRQKPNNVKNVIGQFGAKPYQNVKLSTINGSIELK